VIDRYAMIGLLKVKSPDIIERLYRHLRHGLRVQSSFAYNYLLLRQLRKCLNQANPAQKIIAVVLLEHLGDIVACEPVSRYLRAQNPDAFIIWVVKKQYMELINSNSSVDKAVVVHCLSERIMLEKSRLFDEVIDLHFTDRHCSLCRRPLRKERGASGINLTNYFHYGSLLSSMTKSAGLPALEEQPIIYIPESSVRKVDSLKLPNVFVVINCTSNSPDKSWPPDKWVQLLDKMKEEFGVPVFEIGTKPFIAGSLSVSQNLCGTLSILESAEVIRRAKLFIGIDSGPAHLANAVGVHGVILMGSYLGFNRYNPFSGAYQSGENAEVIRQNGSAANIPVEQVLSAVRRALNRVEDGRDSAAYAELRAM
jgi:heptosyltransferase III